MTNYGSQLASAFSHANPGVAPSAFGPGHAATQPGGAGAPAGAEAEHHLGANRITRTAAAGGALTELFQHPSFLPTESLFRKLAEEAMFSATPQRPFKFELGAIEVPKNQAMLIADFGFRLFRLSGAAAGDTVPLEPERLSTLLAFDFTVSTKRQATLRMEIDPVPIEATKEAYLAQASGGTVFPGAPAGAGLARAVGLQFNLARFARSVVPAGAGLSGLPNRERRIGPPDFPFTQVAVEGQRVQGTCTIFRPIPIPIAFFELDVSGFLMSMNTMRQIMETLKPVTDQEGRLGR